MLIHVTSFLLNILLRLASSRISRKPVRKAEPITPEILGLLFKQYGESNNLVRFVCVLTCICRFFPYF